MTRNNQFGIFFKHFNGEETRNLNHKPTAPVSRATQCTLEHYDANGEVKIAHIQNAFCSQNDDFVKSVGRKVALRKLLYRNFPGGENREFRTLVWKAYFDQIEKDRVKAPVYVKALEIA